MSLSSFTWQFLAVVLAAAVGIPFAASESSQGGFHAESLGCATAGTTDPDLCRVEMTITVKIVGCGSVTCTVDLEGTATAIQGVTDPTRILRFYAEVDGVVDICTTQANPLAIGVDTLTDPQVVSCSGSVRRDYVTPTGACTRLHIEALSHPSFEIQTVMMRSEAVVLVDVCNPVGAPPTVVLARDQVLPAREQVLEYSFSVGCRAGCEVGQNGTVGIVPGSCGNGFCAVAAELTSFVRGDLPHLRANGETFARGTMATATALPVFGSFTTAEVCSSSGGSILNPQYAAQCSGVAIMRVPASAGTCGVIFMGVVGGDGMDGVGTNRNLVLCISQAGEVTLAPQ